MLELLKKEPKILKGFQIGNLQFVIYVYRNVAVLRSQGLGSIKVTGTETECSSSQL